MQHRAAFFLSLSLTCAKRTLRILKINCLQIPLRALSFCRWLAGCPVSRSNLFILCKAALIYGHRALQWVRATITLLYMPPTTTRRRSRLCAASRHLGRLAYFIPHAGHLHKNTHTHTHARPHWIIWHRRPKVKPALNRAIYLLVCIFFELRPNQRTDLLCDAFLSSGVRRASLGANTSHVLYTSITAQFRRGKRRRAQPEFGGEWNMFRASARAIQSIYIS